MNRPADETAHLVGMDRLKYPVFDLANSPRIQVAKKAAETPEGEPRKAGDDSQRDKANDPATPAAAPPTTPEATPAGAASGGK